MDEKRQEYFLKLYEPVHKRFEKFCRARAYGGMDYQDLINETLLIAYQKMDTLRSEASFLSFLFSISVRLLANNKRKKKEEIGFSMEFLASFPDLNAQTDLDADVTFLHEAMLGLPEEQREAIILFEISGFSLKEICKIQNASLSAVKQRLRRGRQKLAEILTYATQVKKEEVYNEK